jgi:DUF917 family protein
MKANLMREITLDDVLPIAIGAGILGTGGGGNTYVGRTWLAKEMRDRNNQPVTMLDADEVADEGMTCCVGMMGAPTISLERLDRGDEQPVAVRALERHIRKPMAALVCSEIGGANSMLPLICGLQMGLPVVDGDPMGRAFPELQMDTFSMNGVSPDPIAVTDHHHNVSILRVDSARRAEQYARTLTIQMGGSAALVMPVMTGATMKKYIIRGTYGLAQRIGQAVLDARKTHADPADIVAELGHGRVLFRGKINDVERRTVKGFARGRLRLSSFGNPGDTLDIVFQNENLVAWHNGDIVCTVPDLICILNLDDGEPVQTEMLRYGLRVAVLGLPAARELKRPHTLQVIGPAAFGYPDIEYQPLPGDLL